MSFLVVADRQFEMHSELPNHSPVACVWSDVSSHAHLLHLEGFQVIPEAMLQVCSLLTRGADTSMGISRERHGRGCVTCRSDVAHMPNDT